jgi:hypothetical protein
MTFCPMKIKSWGFTVFSWTILGHMTWAFICSLSEAQKGAKDMGQIKALAGWLPVTSATRASVLALLDNLKSCRACEDPKEWTDLIYGTGHLPHTCNTPTHAASHFLWGLPHGCCPHLELQTALLAPLSKAEHNSPVPTAGTSPPTPSQALPRALEPWDLWPMEFWPSIRDHPKGRLVAPSHHHCNGHGSVCLRPPAQSCRGGPESGQRLQPAASCS